MENKKERIFENTYAAVNIKSKKILSMIKVTYEHVHDSNMLLELVENIIKLKNMAALGKLLFGDDSAYDCNDILNIYQTMELHLALK